MHAAVTPFARRAPGVLVPGWPMLRPGQIDGVLKAARHRQAASALRAPATPAARRAPEVFGGQLPMRRAQSLPADPAASGTGINHWWRYQEQPVPGGGQVMVNVGTGNLLLQDDDMSVPHKGLAMAFRRTYNSQSGHDVNATDAAGFKYKPPGMYGNGWTSTFDAHIARNDAMTLYSVFDIDGARYDYDATWSADQTTGTFTPRAGNHTALAYDGVCGYLWTKKSGTTYYFYAPGPHAPCPQTGGSTEGFTGRLYQIVGRNRNTYITFNYSWDNGISSLTGKISQITATTESGTAATLAFADVNGHRLLQQLTFPDSTTTVQYQYDSAGNLLTVSHPPNNAPAPNSTAGTRPVQWYGYQTLGSGSVLYYATSPRYWAACQIACGSDGAALFFGYTGSTPATATVNFIEHFGVVNPALSDGSNSAILQPGYAQTAFVYLEEFYTTGVATPTLRDTDGHMTNWVVDGLGRPSQTQECTASASQGQQCTGIWLVTSESWDADNNLVAEIDARGNETDYAYDVHGNTVAAAAPPPATGAFRPTRLFTYDAQDNLTAYCDANATHSLPADWAAPPTAPAPGQGGLCPQTTVATQYQWTPSASEPFGELTAAISAATTAAPTGYRRTFSYDASQQGGTDYGLPTRVTGAAVTQSGDAATPTRTPQQTFWYDGSGNVVCYGTGNGQWVLTYDSLGRLKTAADPDDSVSGTGVCGKTGAQPNWNTTAHTSYFPDGSVSEKQSASQFAAGIGTTFTYDLDGNVTTETYHYGCMSVASCTAGVTRKWYDAADRLVEVQQPYDASDIQQYPWSTRYIYDLSQGGVTPYRGMGLAGYGNLVSTQELLSGTVWAPAVAQTYGISTATWTDARATSFDALSRPLSSFEAAFGDQPKTTNAYDGPGAIGLLSAVSLATGEIKSYAYDADGRTIATTYPNDPTGSITPRIDVAYDPAGHVTSRTTATLGTETFAYDATGALITVNEPASLGGGTVQHHYYADGARSDTTYAGAPYALTIVAQYAYRTDGKRETLQLPNGARFAWTYTAAGRETSQSDPYTGTTIHPTATRTGTKDQPIPIYPSSMTYAARTATYDSYGRIASVTLPEGFAYSYSAAQHTLEDGVGEETRGATQTACLRTNVRNEQLPATGPVPCANVPFSPVDVNGTVLVAGSGGDLTRSQGNGGVWTLDGRSGMKLNNQVTDTHGFVDGSRYGYDASGRMTSDYEAVDGGCPSSLYVGTCYRYGNRTKTYDAENRLRSDTYPYVSTLTQNAYGYSYGAYWMEDQTGYQPPNLSVDYDASNHPARIAAYHPDWGTTDTLAWLWDGNDRFLQCRLVNNQCGQLTFSLDGLADYDPQAAQATVYDRNASGLVVISHNSQSFSSWTEAKAPGPQTAPRLTVGTCSDGDAGDPATCAKLRNGKLANDGWSIDNDTWQGIRTMDPSVGQWNTPDAYAGEVHDPMSQKPFMWNRNNPYDYSDPSGYCVGPLIIYCYEILVAGSVIVGEAQGPGQGGAIGTARALPAIGEGLYKSFGVAMWRTRGPGGPVMAGGLAGAVRHELATGQLVGGKSHLTKGAEIIRGLTNWLRNNPGAPKHDIETAEKWLKDLKDAFGNVNPDQFIAPTPMAAPPPVPRKI
jgi:YD repeat-containing protein